MKNLMNFLKPVEKLTRCFLIYIPLLFFLSCTDRTSEDVIREFYSKLPEIKMGQCIEAEARLKEGINAKDVAILYYRIYEAGEKTEWRSHTRFEENIIEVENGIKNYDCGFASVKLSSTQIKTKNKSWNEFKVYDFNAYCKCEDTVNNLNPIN